MDAGPTLKKYFIDDKEIWIYMKNPNRETISKLQELPNIGKAISADLKLIGITEPKNLIGKDPIKLYDELCHKKNQRIDPCVIDVFMSVVDFMEGGDAKMWWEFTAKRKEMLARV